MSDNRRWISFRILFRVSENELIPFRDKESTGRQNKLLTIGIEARAAGEL